MSNGDVPLFDPDQLFQWLTYAEGRVRYVGYVRGGPDDNGYEGIAVDLDGEISYGSVDEEWFDKAHYGALVRSMGFKMESSVGMPIAGGPWPTVRVFSPSEVDRIRKLIVQCVADLAKRPRRPSFLNLIEYFSGSVRFEDGWCYIRDDSVASLDDAHAS